MAFSLNYCFRFKTNVEADKNKSVYYRRSVYLEERTRGLPNFVSASLATPTIHRNPWRSSDCSRKFRQPALGTCIVRGLGCRLYFGVRVFAGKFE